MSYIDVSPDAVTGGGQRTGATSGSWQSWASRSESALRDAVGSVRDSVVGASIESHLSAINPSIKGMATSVEALGGNAVAASHTVVNSDTVSHQLLGQHGSSVQGTGSLLRRPVNP